jgi:hypothetical protein
LSRYIRWPTPLIATKAGGEKLAEVIQTVGGGLEDHDGDRSANQVLLISKICVQGDQNVKSSFRKFQEFAVLFSSPARFLNGTTNVTVTYEEFLERGAHSSIKTLM